jgi:hypothetical protein
MGAGIVGGARNVRQESGMTRVKPAAQQNQAHSPTKDETSTITSKYRHYVRGWTFYKLVTY